MLNEIASDTIKYSSENDSDLASPAELPELLEEVNAPSPNEDSPSSDDFLEEIVDIATIKFRTQENEIFTKACKRSSTIGNIKMELSSLFSIPTTQMAVSNGGKVLSENDVLATLGVPAMGILELGLQIEKPYSLNRDVIYGQIPNIDVIVVRTNGYDLIVEIENRCRRKQWLGGYRHKVTNKHYHHAWTQTSSILEGKLTSSTQTTFGLSKHTNTPKAKMTQTSNIPSLTDKIVETGTYLHYVEDMEPSSPKPETPEAHFIPSPTISQGNISSAETTTRSKFIAVASQLRALYREIKKWNQTEHQKLESCDEKTRRTRRVEILNRTRMILLRIGRQRRQLLQQVCQQAEEEQLSEAAKPKLFVCRTGEKIEIDTLGCQEARELCQLYDKYKGTVSVEEQMKAIVNLQAFFTHRSGFEFSKHVVDLLQRDLDIVTYRLECIPSLKARIERFVFYYLQLMSSHCTKNVIPAAAAETRQYRVMLTRLQNDEMNRFRCYTSVAFQMEVADIRHLVGSIWKNCSMDECQDLDQLQLTRWQKNIEWSPWNCILLSKNEIKDHLRANSVEEKYDRCFISKVRNKHLQAKIYFNEISSFHEWFRES